MANPKHVFDFESILSMSIDQRNWKQIKEKLENEFGQLKLGINEGLAEEEAKKYIELFNKVFAKAKLPDIGIDDLRNKFDQVAESITKALGLINNIDTSALKGIEISLDHIASKVDTIADKMVEVKSSVGDGELFDDKQLDKVLRIVGAINRKIKDIKDVADIDDAIGRIGENESKYQNIKQILNGTHKDLDNKKNKQIDNITQIIKDYNTSVAAGDSWEVQYQHMLKYIKAYEIFAKQYKKSNGETKFKEWQAGDGKNPTVLYDRFNTQALHMVTSLQNLVNRFEGQEFVHDKSKPWARENTLQEIKNILSKRLLSNLSSTSNIDKEKFAYINTDSGEISEHIAGEYDSVSNKKQKELLTKVGNSFNATVHTHPELVAAPSESDIKNFANNYALFKKNFILAGEQLAEIDFTSLSYEQTQQLAEAYKQKVLKTVKELDAKLIDMPLKKLGIESLNIDGILSKVSEQLMVRFPDLKADIDEYIENLRSIFNNLNVENLSYKQFDTEEMGISDVVLKNFEGSSKDLRADIYQLTQEAIGAVVGIPSRYQEALRDIFKQTIIDSGFDPSQIFKLHNVRDFDKQLDIKRRGVVIHQEKAQVIEQETNAQKELNVATQEEVRLVEAAYDAVCKQLEEVDAKLTNARKELEKLQKNAEIFGFGADKKPEVAGRIRDTLSKPKDKQFATYSRNQYIVDKLKSGAELAEPTNDVYGFKREDLGSGVVESITKTEYEYAKYLSDKIKELNVGWDEGLKILQSQNGQLEQAQQTVKTLEDLYDAGDKAKKEAYEKQARIHHEYNKQQAIAQDIDTQTETDAIKQKTEAIKEERIEVEKLNEAKHSGVEITDLYFSATHSDPDIREFKLNKALQNNPNLISELTNQRDSLQAKLQPVDDIAYRISSKASIKGLSFDKLKQEASEVSKRLSTMYDEGVRNTEEYVALQYKLLHIFEKLESSYGGMKNSGAVNHTEFRNWISKSIEEATGFNPMTEQVIESLWGQNDFSIMRTNEQPFKMREMAGRLQGNIFSEYDRSRLSELNIIIDELNKLPSVVKEETVGLKEMVEEAGKNGVHGQSVAEASGVKPVGDNANINLQELQNILNAITYNVKIISDGNVQEPWALESTLQTIKGVLDNIQVNTTKIGTGETQYHAMDRIDAMKYIAQNADHTVWEDWFSRSLHEARRKIAETLESDMELRNAALNQLYDDYKGMTKSDISYEEFLNTPITLYRGHRFDNQFEPDKALSFSLNKDMAEQFGGVKENEGILLEIQVLPKDILGAPRPLAQTSPEAEVLVPVDQLNKMPAYAQFKQTLKDNVPAPEVDTQQQEEEIRRREALEQKLNAAYAKRHEQVQEEAVIADEEAEIIAKENGTLEDKLERLNELSSMWGQEKISQSMRDRYEVLNQKDMDSGLTSKEEDRMSELYEEISTADEALEEFGQTYDKIILKLGNGKKVTILPNDKGLKDLYKIGDEYGETYNGVEIEDITFERRIKQDKVDLLKQAGVENIAQAASDYVKGEFLSSAEALLFKLFHDYFDINEGFNQLNLSSFLEKEGFVDSKRSEIEPLLMGLSAKYPNLINYTNTNGLDAISLQNKEMAARQENVAVINAEIEAVKKLKEEQLAYILKNNPAADDTHTWIRSIQDIKTFEEALQDSDYHGWQQDGFTPDYTGKMAEEALTANEITVYSSKPIELGNWVTPSKIEAGSYAGSGTVYSKKVALSDIAWTDPMQGQYTPKSDLATHQQQITAIKQETEAQEKLNEELQEQVNLKQMVEEAGKHGVPGQSVAEAAGAKVIQDVEVSNADKSSLINTEELKTILSNITYNVKITSDTSETNDNTQEAWALESTLQTVKTVLEGIQTNTAKIGTVEAVAPTDNSTLTAIKTAVESLDKKIVKGTKTIATKASGGRKKAAQTAEDALLDIKNPKELGDVKATKVPKVVKALENEYARLGELQGSDDNVKQVEAKQLERRLEKTIKQLEEEKLINDEIKKRLNLIRYEAQQNQIKIENAKQERKEKQIDVREERKRLRKEEGVNAANTAWNAGKRTLGATWKINDYTDEYIKALPQVKALEEAMKDLGQRQYDVNLKIAKNQKVLPAEVAELNKATDATNKYTAELKELITNYEFFNGQNSQSLNVAYAGGDKESQLKQAIMLATNGKAQLGKYDTELERWSYTVKGTNNEIKHFTAGLDELSQEFRAVHTDTKKTESLFETIKRKTKEVFTYFSGSSMVYKVFNELKKGIQYIKEIDSALTELKKVTDETEETYNKFLDTASKTAAKVGSTIKEVVSSTADFARLGYSLKEAAVFAESAQILMNVSEFTDVSRATDTLISAVQAFGYTAETSMDVVDLLNMIGNNYAISTADLAQSLTKSSASLVAAGGNLAEAAALTATANKIVQDADSVGK